MHENVICRFDPPVDVAGALASGDGDLDKHDDLNYLPKQRHLKVTQALGRRGEEGQGHLGRRAEEGQGHLGREKERGRATRGG